MSKRLSANLCSDYIAAANRLRPKTARRRIVAYVESFDDVFFWSTLLRPLESETAYFEVMLPSRSSLCKGKKIALANRLGDRLGESMIACVDADYDYLLQGRTETSRLVCRSPYVFHTYVYAIENFRCYAPALHSLCVMCTLNDRRLFDFEAFLSAYSQVVWSLFVWSIWAYRHGFYTTFSMLDLYHIVALEHLNFYHPEQTITALRHRVNAKVARLQRRFPQARSDYKPLAAELQQLGVTPATTYLYVRGHDLCDGIVAPMVAAVCEALRREREREIRRLAEHDLQMQNELAAYRNAVSPVDEMLRKHTAYTTAPQYLQVQSDLRAFLAKDSGAAPIANAAPES